MNPLKELLRYGQSPWLDYVQRGLLASGGLRRLVEEDGIRGVTSNPSIFEKAIAGSADYRDDIQALRRDGLSAQQIYERLAIGDIGAAADELRALYDSSARRDGYVSLEVSPHLAHDTAGTVAEARRLWAEVGRPNLMIKVPATPAGIPAVETLIAEGINVNVTLIFSQAQYVAAAEAYIAGLNRRIAEGAGVAGVASVASYFVSRIDTAVDARLDRLIAAAEPARGAALAALRGTAAVASARLVYRRFRGLLATPRWQRLAQQGAVPQRLLWASTSTKDPSYRDVVYVEELIGPDTVNTLPLATLQAFRDHGVVRETLDASAAGARATLQDLTDAGIALEAVSDELLVDGVRLFAHAFNAVLLAIERARAAA